MVLGSSHLLDNPAAMLMEATDLGGLCKARSLAEEMLTLEPRLALILPRQALDACQSELTALAAADPAHCAQAIRWRRSTHEGRPWARPQKLQQELQAATARAQLTGRPSGQAALEAAGAILVSLQGTGVINHGAAL